MMTQVSDRRTRTGRETIHSGHFMVSHFEAEAQDDYDDVAVPVPEEEHVSQKCTINKGTVLQMVSGQLVSEQQQFSIETSLTKLFKCMTLAYRQKLTSPKWNRFKGIKLRWKDKIRLNNVIWRCWHMQFIKKQSPTVCQFASPLDVDTHVKPETTILEGKYWKRRAEAIKAEYKKWRMFFLSRHYGKEHASREELQEMDSMDIFHQNDDMSACMLVDEDYINFMSDTLFSTITSNQPFAFPDSREIARGANLADFIQPSLGPLQPNLDDYMDTLEPLQELFGMSRLPPVPEEAVTAHDGHYTMETQSVQQRQNEQSLQPQLQVPAQMEHRIMKTEQFRDLTQFAVPLNQYPTPPNDKLYETQQYPKSYSVITQGTAQQPNAGLPHPQMPTNYQSRSPTIFSTQYQTTYSPPLVSLDPRKVITFEAKPVSNIHRQNSLPQMNYISQSRPPESIIISNRQQDDIKRSKEMKLEPCWPKPEPSQHFEQRLKGNSSHFPVALSEASSSGQKKSVAQTKETYRSNSLPIGSQLNTDWSITTNRRGTLSGVSVKEAHTPKPRPLLAAASEPAITQSSVLLAHLLTRQHSASAQRLNYPDDEPCSPSAVQSGSGRVSPASPRRSTHLHAEQKRRFNINNGFDTLHSLLPHLHHNPSPKVSKAALLQKGAEYIRQLKADRNELTAEMESLKQQIDSLNNAISNCHALLPATGAPVYRGRSTRLREMFLDHVAARSTADWKYWLFSVILSVMLESFSACVSSNNAGELARTTLLWAEQHCSLAEIRPAVLLSLRTLCTATDILTHPERLPTEARAAALRGSPTLKRESPS